MLSFRFSGVSSSSAITEASLKVEPGSVSPPTA